MSMIQSRLAEATKAAMRARDSERLTVLRGLQAAIKQVEINSRAEAQAVEINDAAVTSILEKQRKQRQESLAAYQQAGRAELAAREQFELEVIESFLPLALTESEVTQLLEQAIAATQATQMRDMGKVMEWLKPHVTGRVDAAALAKQVKSRLS